MATLPLAPTFSRMTTTRAPRGARSAITRSQHPSPCAAGSAPGAGEAPLAVSVVVTMTDTAAARRRWAQSLIRKAHNPPPSYGSVEWLALPEGSPAKVASVCVAAESWAVDGDDMEARLHRQLDDERRAFKHAEDADYQARASEHRKQYRHLSVAPEPRYTGQVARPLEEIGAEYMASRKGARA